MQSLKYAVRFISASFSLAIKNAQLRKPWVRLSLGNLLLMVLWLIPLALVVGWIGLEPVGLILIGLISILLMVSLFAWGEITALQTSQIFAAFLQEEAVPAPDSKMPVMPDRYGDIVILVLSLPGLQFIQGFRALFKNNENTLSAWFNARALVLPVIALENLSLAWALDRVNQIVRDRLLRFRSTHIGVRRFANVVQWILVLSGAVLGYLAAINLADPITAGSWQRILGTAVGVFVGGIPVTLGILFSTFARTCYHTALYQWVRNVETAHQQGDAGQASVPPILRQVLGKYSSSKKER